LLPEEVGVHVDINIYKKPSVGAPVAMDGGKRLEVVAIHHAVLAVADFAGCRVCRGVLYFMKKVATWF
jgi:hypothetical protein